jgi:hypothetical protein
MTHLEYRLLSVFCIQYQKLAWTNNNIANAPKLLHYAYIFQLAY